MKRIVRFLINLWESEFLLTALDYGCSALIVGEEDWALAAEAAASDSAESEESEAEEQKTASEKELSDAATYFFIINNILLYNSK